MHKINKFLEKNINKNRTICNLHYTKYTIYSIQHTTYNIQHTTYNIQHITDNIQYTIYTVCSIQLYRELNMFKDQSNCFTFLICSGPGFLYIGELLSLMDIFYSKPIKFITSYTPPITIIEFLMLV